MRILIISGGDDSERRISLMSAKQVKKALESTGNEVKIFDLRDGQAKLRSEAVNFDVLFPVLHGEQGESGQLQKFLKTLKTPFVGQDLNLEMSEWYKIPFKKWCNQNQILTADWTEIKTKSDILKFGLPAVLKSSAGGSSREVAVIKSKADLYTYHVNKILKLNNLMVERYLEGVEITVGIFLGKPLPVVEIVPEAGQWFDYKNKYWGKTQEIVNAPSLTEKQRQEAQAIALRIHQKLGLGPFPRIDFIVSKGEPYVLEFNTIPGVTNVSLLPKASQAEGVSFEQMCQKLVESVS